MSYESPLRGNLIGSLLGANMNTTADQAIVISANKYVPTKVVFTNASATPTLAVGGLYTGPTRSGTALVGALQVYSALTNALSALIPSLTALSGVLTTRQLWWNLTVANGSPLTVDIYIFGDVFFDP